MRGPAEPLVHPLDPSAAPSGGGGGTPGGGAPAGPGGAPRAASPVGPRAAAAPLTWRRLAGPWSLVAVGAAGVAAVAETLAAVVTGRLADDPARGPLLALALLLLGSTLLDTAGRTVFSGVVGRAEGALRADLLGAALHQPLPRLDEQAVGEVIDRVDDDPWQVATLLRRVGWEAGRAGLRAVLAWVVAGLTWWPAWVAFPLVGVLVVAATRRLARVVAERKVVEEAAWSEHAAQLEEAVAGRDDVRTALGQAHVVRQYAVRSAELLRRVAATCRVSAAVTLRSSLLVHALLAAVAVGGVAAVGGDALDVAGLVTLFVLVSTFVGQLSQVTNNLPELQEGLGALARIRSLMSAPSEPVGGLPVPRGPLGLQLRELTFGYEGTAILRGITLDVPAGTTVALVGRTGAGKTTLVRLLSRAVEPPPGTVLVGGQDVVATDLADLRRAVGVVTQRTELLAATLAENVTLFADVPRERVRAALSALGLDAWVDSLPQGLDTRLGVGGTTLSAGEEQLVAFARLLVRDVAVVVLDEATARMDPRTEALVGRATDRLLAGRTGVVIAHRLSTTRRADAVAVLEAGALVQHGPRERLAGEPGPYRELLRASGAEAADAAAPRSAPAPAAAAAPVALAARSPRRRAREVAAPARPSTARTVLRVVLAHPAWGLVGAAAFTLYALLGAYGAFTGWAWGHLVAELEAEQRPWGWAAVVVTTVMTAPLVVAAAFRLYPPWWVAVTLRLRLAVLRGQTAQQRLARTPPGEVVARALDSDRLVIYVDRWVDVAGGVLVVTTTALLARSALAGAVVGAVLVVSAVVCAAGAPLAGSSAREAGDQRARFGRSLASVLDAARSVKLAGATATVEGHLRAVDARRVAASVLEHRVRALLEGVPALLVQAGVVTAWAVHLAGAWPLATAVLVTTAVTGASWFGTVAGAVVTETPVARRWLAATGALAGSRDLVGLPRGVDLVAGTAPAPPPTGRVPLRRLTLEGVAAVHDDGTVGVSGVDLTVERGDLVLLAGRVGSGKSSLLAALAGLVDHEGSIRWNGTAVDDPQLFLRPGQVAHVGQLPRVLSGTFVDNVALDHDRAVGASLDDARMRVDVEAAGGHGALVGHRGVRLSGGQVQRLALARALATGAELLVADDVSSALDARTEVELWEGLRARGVTVVGSSAKRSALERADRVVVLEDGRVADEGPWSALAERWGHLAG